MTTNFEKIKSLNIDEVAEWLCDNFFEQKCYKCPYCYDDECFDKIKEFFESEDK